MKRGILPLAILAALALAPASMVLVSDSAQLEPWLAAALIARQGDHTLLDTAARAHETPLARYYQALRLRSEGAHAQAATDDAFDLLHRILAMRLRRGRLTVVDATNVEAWARAELLDVARRHRRPAVAIVLDLPLDVALARNLARPEPRPPGSRSQRTGPR